MQRIKNAKKPCSNNANLSYFFSTCLPREFIYLWWMNNLCANYLELIYFLNICYRRIRLGCWFFFSFLLFLLLCACLSSLVFNCYAIFLSSASIYLFTSRFFFISSISLHLHLIPWEIFYLFCCSFIFSFWFASLWTAQNTIDRQKIEVLEWNVTKR